MRFLHTSDLHLGRSLYGVNRDETFEKFLVWLTETIRTESIDCLIIAGDVFDNAPPRTACSGLTTGFWLP